MPVYKIGLTGGMGSGKSTAAKIFSEFGIPVIDADIIARELVEPSQPALAEIIAFFGKEILTPTGELNRARLRNLIFENEKLRGKLEAILHPRIIQEMNYQAIKLADSTPYCIFVIPLLLETAQERYVNRILVIDAPNDIQRYRIKVRDGLSDTKINPILRTQCPNALRLAAADDSISNNTDLTALYHQIKCYHQQYLILAQQHAS